MKLLDTTGGNTKIKKTMTKGKGAIRVAQLSMMPTRELCPGSKAAGCMDACLKSAGLATVFSSINDARQRKTALWETDRQYFITQLMHELRNFDKLCKRQGVQGVVRLNVLSDIAWEEYDVPQSFPDLQFYDYTKRGLRVIRFEHYRKHWELDNYRLIFSYSGRPQFAKQVALVGDTDVPMAVVFRGKMPEQFMGRPVIDGDQSDWDNVNAGRVVVGLKAKGQAKHDTTGFVVDTDNLIAVGA